MALKDDMIPFLDKNGYANPGPVVPGSGRSCDNATMFSSEEYIMLSKLNQLSPEDIVKWSELIKNAMTLPGLPGRYPGYSDQDSPDNMVATLAAAATLGVTDIPRSILWYGIKHLGSFNNSEPSKFTFQAMTWRQIQLVAATVSAAFPSYLNPLHWIARTVALPFYFAAAVTIFISCINAPPSDADSRRLSWHLIQAVVRHSIMCRIASAFWWHRLYSVYGKLGMRGVAAKYYSPTHPFIKYWQD